jgi:hypothetical protein
MGTGTTPAFTAVFVAMTSIAAVGALLAGRAAT